MEWHDAEHGGSEVLTEETVDEWKGQYRANKSKSKNLV